MIKFNNFHNFFSINQQFIIGKEKAVQVYPGIFVSNSEIDK